MILLGPTAENDPIIKEVEKARKFSIVKFHENNLIFNHLHSYGKVRRLFLKFDFYLKRRNIISKGKGREKL